MSRFLYKILDIFWPTLEPISELSKKHKIQCTDKNESLVNGYSWSSLDKAINIINNLITEEKKRRQGIETRLISAIGFSVITATISLNITKGELLNAYKTNNFFMKLSVFVIVIYLTSQLVHVGLSAIKGLGRRHYIELALEDLVIDENIGIYPSKKRTYLHSLCRSWESYKDNNNNKVECMALAHASIRNYLIGVILLAFLSGFLQFNYSRTLSLSDELIQAIQNDPALVKRLTGPPGPSGPPGPPGPPGTSNSTTSSP